MEQEVKFEPTLKKTSWMDSVFCVVACAFALNTVLPPKSCTQYSFFGAMSDALF